LHYYSRNERSEVRENTLDEITKIISTINVYEFLKLPVAVLRNDEYGIKKLEERCEWLDFQETLSRLNKILFKAGAAN